MGRARWTDDVKTWIKFHVFRFIRKVGAFRAAGGNRSGTQHGAAASWTAAVLCCFRAAHPVPVAVCQNPRPQKLQRAGALQGAVARGSTSLPMKASLFQPEPARIRPSVNLHPAPTSRMNPFSVSSQRAPRYFHDFSPFLTGEKIACCAKSANVGAWLVRA